MKKPQNNQNIIESPFPLPEPPGPIITLLGSLLGL